MAIAHDAEPAPRSERRVWARDNPLVRALGRVPLPLGGKLLVGFALVAALLALVAGVGLVALSHSNSRGQQLLRLQSRAVRLQIVLTDATQLKTAIEFRLNAPGSRKRFGSSADGIITNDFTQLCVDSGLGGCLGFRSPGPFDLSAVDRSAYRKIAGSIGLFYVISGNTAAPIGNSRNGADPVRKTLEEAEKFATGLAVDVGATARTTRARANALVAANRSSFTRSRNLLIGVGAGGVFLALALGLLLSWSVVAPLRRTQERLSAIASGDFAGHVDVPIRDSGSRSRRSRSLRRRRPARARARAARASRRRAATSGAP